MYILQMHMRLGLGIYHLNTTERPNGHSEDSCHTAINP
jgi:hypothetical protein